MFREFLNWEPISILFCDIMIFVNYIMLCYVPSKDENEPYYLQWNYWNNADPQYFLFINLSITSVVGSVSYDFIAKSMPNNVEKCYFNAEEGDDNDLSFV